MNLSRKQLLLIHSVLFSYLSNSDTSRESEAIEDLMDEISQAILDFEDENDSFQKHKGNLPFRSAEMSVFGGEEEEEIDTSEIVSFDDLMDLEDVSVFDCDAESKGRLNFFWSLKDRSCAIVKYKEKDVDLSDSEILRINWINRQAKSFTLGVPGSEFNFEVSKFPKDWTSLLKVNTTYRIT